MRYLAIAVAALSALRLGDASPCKAPTKSVTAAGVTSSTSSTSVSATSVSTPTSTPTNPDEVIYNVYPDGAFKNGLSGATTYGVVTLDGVGKDGNAVPALEAGGEDDADGAVAKRAATGSASLTATLHNLQVGSSYTVLFYYAVASNAVASTCRMRSYLGSNNYLNSAYFPDVITAGSPVTWVTAIKAVTATSRTQDFVLALTCKTGGGAKVYVDSIFITNKATPETIEDIIKNWGTAPSSTSTRAASSTAVNSVESSSVAVVSTDSTTASASSAESSQSVSVADTTASAGSSTQSISVVDTTATAESSSVSAADTSAAVETTPAVDTTAAAQSSSESVSAADTTAETTPAADTTAAAQSSSETASAADTTVETTSAAESSSQSASSADATASTTPAADNSTPVDTTTAAQSSTESVSAAGTTVDTTPSADATTAVSESSTQSGSASNTPIADTTTPAGTTASQSEASTQSVSTTPAADTTTPAGTTSSLSESSTASLSAEGSSVSTTPAADTTTPAGTTSSLSGSSTPSLSAEGSSVSTTPAVDTTTPAGTTTSASESSTQSASTTPSTTPSSSTSAAPIATIDSTILIIARDDAGVTAASLGLLAYGIPYESLIVPSAGIELPTLNDTKTHGNYGGIIVMDAVSYSYDSGWASAITAAQWTTLHAYQTDFSVRMVRINEWPGVDFGVTTVSTSCCDSGVEQSVYFSDVSDFPTANIKANAEMATDGLYHVPATITDTATTKAVAMFGIATGFTSESVAAVINNFSGREQFVWFMSWAPDWSETSSFLQHAHIHWMTRGVFLGKRKVHLSCQIDDLQLSTELYLPAGTDFKLEIADLEAHVAWQTSLNSRLPSGSAFWLEFGHNGNGDFISAAEVPNSDDVCIPAEAIDYDEVPDTELEFMKALGTGEDRWPTGYETYNWTKTCAQLDDFAAWFMVEENRNAFAHVSHTFTHLELNNATYHDAAREIEFNQAWLAQTGIDQATHFSPHGIIPPAITGLHNGDVIRAWMDNGINHVVGDNTRSVLRNTGHTYWPLTSTVASNGYDGLTIVPRFSLAIYYNCATAECCAAEWAAISSGSGVFDDLMAISKSTNVRNLLALMADPYMFHQANMHQTTVETRSVGDYSAQMSLVMYWTETMAQEIARLTNWPVMSLKHDDIAQYFLDRQTVDGCNPKLSYTFSDDGLSIKSITVTADGNTCSAKIPVTIPSGSSTASGGSVTSDVVGSEPPIQWVTLNGSPVTLTLSSPVAL